MGIDTTGTQCDERPGDRSGECGVPVRRAGPGMSIREKLEEEFRRTFATRARNADRLHGTDVKDRGKR